MHYVEIRALDTLEDACAAVPGQAKLVAQSAAHSFADETALAEKLARPQGHFSHRGAPFSRQRRRRGCRCSWSADRRFEVALASAERLEVRARHVEPAVLPVAREILPEVGQLQRRAQGVGRSIEGLVAVAGDAQDQPADGIAERAQ